MSVLNDIMSSVVGVPVLFEQLGTSITYTAKGVAGVEITAIVGAEHREERETENGIEQYRVRDVTLSKADVADPQLNASVTIGSETWKVAPPMETMGSSVRFAVELPASVQRSTPGYRS